eukprot:scaffold6663_cov92-Cylindrotheca_fusiformis.AAC.4
MALRSLLLAELALSCFVALLFCDEVSSLQDGQALSPPMGWRSWNLYGTNVTQELLVRIMQGLDDNWQIIEQPGTKQCTYHDSAGYPMINLERFPSMKSLTRYAHKLGLTVGWYFNNCYGCHERCPLPNQPSPPHYLDRPNNKTWNRKIYLAERQGTAHERCYQGDVQALVDYDFDGVKLDACGWQMDLDLWSSLISQHQQQDRPILIEACHWGKTIPGRPNYVVVRNNTIDASWCPFHYWRTSGDIWASYGSILAILQWSMRFKGLSRPGCWAHLDMLEVGCGGNGGPNGLQDVGLTKPEAQTHFAAWAIMSSPLFLSHDVTNEDIMDEVWPIISNQEIIAINQAWAGFSGGPFWKSSETLQFTFEGIPNFRPWIHKGLFLYKPLERLQVNDISSNRDSYTRVAVLLINSDTVPANFTLNLFDIPELHCVSRKGNSTTVRCAIRDVWKHVSIGIVRDEFVNISNVESHDCAFLIIETAPSRNGDNWTNVLAISTYLEVTSVSKVLSVAVMVFLGIILLGQRVGLAKRRKRRKE